MIVVSDVSYLALVIMLTAESCILFEILRETLDIKQAYRRIRDEGASRANGPRLNTPVPTFRIRFLSSRRVLTQETIRGQETIFLFITADAGLNMHPQVLPAVISAMLTRVLGKVYIVCAGSKDVCDRLVEQIELKKRYGQTVGVLHDVRGDLMRRFSITSTPSAVIVDEDGKIDKTGQLSWAPESVEQTDLVASEQSHVTV